MHLRLPADLANWFWTGAPQPVHSNVIVVPYMTQRHDAAGSELVNGGFCWQCLLKSKSLLMVQSFRSRTGLRANLRLQCGQHEDVCLHYEPNNSRQAWFPSTQEISSFNYTHIQELHQQAWFCVQPHGDTPTRAAMYGCWLDGAIVVVFDPNVTHTLAFQDYIDYSMLSIYVDPAWLEQMDLYSILSTYTQKDLHRRYEYLYAVRKVFRYSENPYLDLKQTNLDSIESNEDATSLAVKSVLRRASLKQNRGSVTRHRKLPVHTP